MKRGDATAISVSVKGSEAEGFAERIWEIRTERSHSPKYLPLKAGYFRCFQRVILKDEDGKEMEISMNEPPREESIESDHAS